MIYQVGDNVIIRHRPVRASMPDIVIKCVVVKVNTISNTLIVDSENQKGIAVPLRMIEKDDG